MSLPQSSGSSIYDNRPLEYDDSIRLLRVVKSELTGSFYGSLLCQRLSNSPEYHALSYTWGAKDDHPRSIVIDGSSFAIGSNLWEFLLNLGRRSLVWIWVDAICIDQLNDQEKGHQVALMGRIYSMAYTTIVWLGAETVDQKSCSDLDLIAQRCPEHDIQKQMAHKKVGQMSRTTSLPDHSDLRVAILHFCAKQYWTRAWILQEVILAESVEIQCGDQILTWNRLRIALDMCHDLSDVVRQEIDQTGLRAIVDEHNFYHEYQSGGRGFDTLIRSYAKTGCAIARDRVFALISLISQKEDPLYIPIKSAAVEFSSTIKKVIDYRKAPEVLFTEIMQLYQPKNLFDFAMPLFRALELNIWSTQDFPDDLYVYARLHRVPVISGDSILYVFAGDDRQGEIITVNKAQLSLANTILSVSKDSGQVTDVDFFFETTHHGVFVYCGLSEIIADDPCAITLSLLHGLKKAIIDCESDLLRLSVNVMTILSKLGSSKAVQKFQAVRLWCGKYFPTPKIGVFMGFGVFME